MKPNLFLLFAGLIIAGLLISSVSAVSPEAEAQWKIAKDLLAGGKCLPALFASEKAISMDPQFSLPWNVKGVALHCLGRNREALEAFNRSLELDPDFSMAKKNLNHVLLDIRNGAPLDTPAVVVPAVRNTSISYDGELGYAPIGEPTGCCAFLQDGHAVYYTNNRTITVTGIRMAGCRYGDTNGNIRVEIWDKNFTTLYSDLIPYDRIPFNVVKDEGGCLAKSSWVDIALPNHAVTGDFYMVLFSGSLPMSQKGPGIYIVYETPSETGTSYAVMTRPNRPDQQKIGEVGYLPEEVDWMIRVLYTVPPAKTVTPGTTQAVETPAGKTEKPATTSVPLGLVSIIGAVSIFVIYSVFRK